MAGYNLDAANKAFTHWAAYLAQDMWHTPDRPPSPERVQYWRELTMEIIQQHKAAHEEIRRLQALVDDG